MTDFDDAREIARMEAIGNDYLRRAAAKRQELTQRALAEHEAKGGAGITWSFPGFGTVTLPLTQEAPAIRDINALKKWVAAEHPEEIETVTQVRSAYQAYLLKNAQIDREGCVVLVDEAGAVSTPIPGMGVSEGGRPKPLAIRIKRDAKDLYAAYAEQEVARQLANEYGPEPEPAESGSGPDLLQLTIEEFAGLVQKHAADCGIWSDVPCTCGAESTKDGE